MTGVADGSLTARRLRHLRLLTTVAWRHAQDDPALLAVQSVRRLPLGVRTAVSRQLLHRTGSENATVRALGFFLADRPAEVQALLVDVHPRTQLGRRLAAELAVQVGRPVPSDAPPSARARAAWGRGDLTEALEVLAAAPGGAARRQRARLASDRETMTPGYRVPAPAHPATHPTTHPGNDTAVPAAPSTGPRVLHLLTNSVPLTHSGYALALALDPAGPARCGRRRSRR